MKTPILFLASFLLLFGAPLRAEIVQTDVRITVNGPPPDSTAFIEYFLTLSEHAAPPISSSCIDDAIVGSGILLCASFTAEGLAASIAAGLTSAGLPPGVSVLATDNILTILNDKDFTGVDLFSCINMIECPSPFGYGFENGSINNVCSGVCGDEGEEPGEFGYNFELRTATNCLTGNVNEGVGSIEDVLFANGSAGGSERTVTVGTLESISVSLQVASGGPTTASYILWVWLGSGANLFEGNPTELSPGPGVLGTTINPTPFSLLGSPQPFRCLRGGLPNPFCSGVQTLASVPDSAPFAVTKSSGLPSPRSFVLQGLLEDNGSPNPVGLSVTNVVTLVVE